MKPYLSIIIPTFNRSDKLSECLSRLKLQKCNAEFEVIVVNDGSPDNTKAVLADWEKKWPKLHAINQENAGQGNARNNALQSVKGEVVLFIGDDIYAGDNFLQKHIDFHKENMDENKACLGLTKWSPQTSINPYMRWLTSGGPQFAYHKLSHNKEASFWFFYTSNISLKKSLLEQESFDPNYRGYGWEDIELAYRLKKSKNLAITFNEDAVAYHDHFMEEVDLPKRMESIGRNAHVFEERHPEIKLIPRGLKRLILSLIGSRLSIGLLSLFKWVPFLKRRYWYALSKRYFMQGVRSV